MKTSPPAPGHDREGLEDRKADVVARALMSRIVGGAYPVGSTLPREEDLVTEHRASRSVIREAIKLLEVHRLVRPVRRRGTEVLDPMRSLSPEVVRAMLVPRPGVVDPAMLAGLLEVRALLDVELSCLAAARRTDEDLRALDGVLTDLRRALPDPSSYALESGRIARTLARATRNPLFEMLSAWNEVVARDLEPLFAATRPAPEPHFEAVLLLVDLVRRREVAGVRELVTAFHAWATPRLLQAAALMRSGETFPVSTTHTGSRPRNGAGDETKSPKSAAKRKPTAPERAAPKRSAPKRTATAATARPAKKPTTKPRAKEPRP